MAGVDPPSLIDLRSKMAETNHVPDAAGESLFTGRIALCLSYNGHQYFGWQSQKSGLPTVQKCIEKAVSSVANEEIEVVCAGRTDKSVHAAYQVVHFDTHAKRDPRSWVFGCNANLPKDISVSWAGGVSTDFHARFSATSRRYHYVIYNHPIRPAHFSSELSWCHHPLDASSMHLAAQCLVGEHDFTSFRAIGCQSRTPFRFLEFVNVTRYGHIIIIDIKGNAFLHHMVRNIAGVLMAIGMGREPIAWCQQVLEARDRTKAAVTAPPYGLFLTHVDYPAHFNIPLSEGAPSIIQSMLHMASGTTSLEDDALWKIAFLERR
jgi:tRNA pseudouridine38-40 synthase